MFIGRKHYLEDLESLWRKSTSSLVACRGRRRIGKSTLFREFAKRTAECYIEIEGLAPRPKMCNQDQLNAFSLSLARETHTEPVPLNNWQDAFCQLDKHIDDSHRTVILLDELSWLAGYDPDFPGTLRMAWERYFHRHDKLIMILCGSVSAWIKKNLLDSTGFTGRFSRNYVLQELSLSECVQFWGKSASRLNVREIIDVLSVTGGVPRYLEEIDPGLSADENIRRLCFWQGGELFQDFDAMFNPLFGQSYLRKKTILEILASGPMTGVELSTKMKVANNGLFAEELRELKEAGFIDDNQGKNPLTGREMRISKYRLRDNYTRFYLKYVAAHKNEIMNGAYIYSSLDQLPEWDTVKGLQFKNLIVNNFREVIPFLGLGNTIIESAAPYHNNRKSPDNERGVQIDLLIQTARTAYIIEVKRQNRIGPDIEQEMERKIARLPLRKGMTVRPVLVYDGELAPSVTGSGYFDALVPVTKLLNL